MIHKLKKVRPGVFELIGVVLIIVILGLSWLVRNLGNELHDLDDDVFASKLERTELQYYDLLMDCHSPEFKDLTDREIRYLCDDRLPQIYDIYVELLMQAKERE